MTFDREAQLEKVRERLRQGKGAVPRWKPGENLVPKAVGTVWTGAVPEVAVPKVVQVSRNASLGITASQQAPPRVLAPALRPSPLFVRAPPIQHVPLSNPDTIKVERSVLQYCLDALQAGSPASCIQAAGKLRALLKK